MGWRIRAWGRRWRQKGMRWLWKGRTVLRPHVRNLVLLYVAIGFLAGVAAAGLRNPEAFSVGVARAATAARGAAHWLWPAMNRTLQPDAKGALGLVEETLPTLGMRDHERPPTMDWRLTLRSWVFTLTGYDFSQPFTFLEVELPGFAIAARERSEVVRRPEPVEPQIPHPQPPSHDEGPVAPEGSILGSGAREPDFEPPGSTWEPVPELTWEERIARADWGSEPLVAVIHAHASEMYRTDTFRPANPQDYHRFGTVETGVIRVGERLVDTLWERFGIPAVHDKALHNTPSHTLAYREARVTVEDLLRRYPSIMYIFDIHRDGVPDVSMVVPVAGQDVAQIAIVVGRPSARDAGRHPNWQRNEAAASRLGALLGERYPGVFRRVLRLNGVYNQDLHPNFLLLEIGNYYDHEEYALRSAELFAEVLAEHLYAERFGESVVRPVVDVRTEELEHIRH